MWVDVDVVVIVDVNASLSLFLFEGYFLSLVLFGVQR